MKRIYPAITFALMLIDVMLTYIGYIYLNIIEKNIIPSFLSHMFGIGLALLVVLLFDMCIVFYIHHKDTPDEIKTVVYNIIIVICSYNVFMNICSLARLY
jgi:uncharacterized membrane protein